MKAETKAAVSKWKVQAYVVVEESRREQTRRVVEGCTYGCTTHVTLGNGPSLASSLNTATASDNSNNKVTRGWAKHRRKRGRVA